MRETHTPLGGEIEIKVIQSEEPNRDNALCTKNRRSSIIYLKNLKKGDEAKNGASTKRAGRKEKECRASSKKRKKKPPDGEREVYSPFR